MKRNIYVLLGSLLTLIILSSCSKSLLVKRHYRDGYYIAHAGSATQTKGVAKSSRNIISKTDQGGSDVTSIVDEPVAEASPVKSSQKIGEPVKVKKTKRHTYVSRLGVQKKDILRKLPSNPAEFKKAVADKSDDALSLIWILIVIIVIVWLIGVLLGGLGLGNLIHLLLVIALVLLILWLLRII